MTYNQERKEGSTSNKKKEQ